MENPTQTHLRPFEGAPLFVFGYRDGFWYGINNFSDDRLITLKTLSECEKICTRWVRSLDKLVWVVFDGFNMICYTSCDFAMEFAKRYLTEICLTSAEALNRVTFAQAGLQEIRKALRETKN